ncbi:MAG: adenylate/guanylate cyclase domain-containing protein [Acidimicrobiales bacterium]|nr:adenylate/guanylate cyclase domain-containing protein [Acidimicrobiales bacterium]
MSTTQYTRVGDGREIAYRTIVVADGPDFVFVPSGTMPIEVLEEDPMMARFLRTLGRYGTVHAIERPGIGASDPLDPDVDYSDQLIDACVAILDDLEVGAAWFVGGVGHGVSFVRLNARRADRLAGAALINPVRHAVERHRVDEVLGRDEQSFGDVMRALAPSRWDDPTYQAWYDRAGRLGASAAAARAFYAAVTASGDAYLRDPDVITEERRVLVIHRQDNRRVSVEDAQWWVDQFPGGELLRVEGDDLTIEAPDSGALADAIGTFATGTRLAPTEDRPLVGVLFADLVGSTVRASEAGDASWRAVLDRFESRAATAVEEQGGTVIKHTGDGMLATCSTASRALEAATQVRRMAADLGLEVRIGVHVGEVEVRGDDIGGIAVHLAARVMDRAGAGQIVMTSTVVQSTIGGRWQVRAIGAADLKGIPDVWELYELI